MTKFLFIVTLLIANLGYSQDILSIGVSGDFATVGKEYGVNENLFLGFNTSKNITLGLDGLMSKVTVDGNSLDTKSLLAYIEGGFPQQGITEISFIFLELLA